MPLSFTASDMTRRLLFLLTISTAIPVFGQEQPVSPTETLRNSVRQWVETMHRIQQEDNDWKRDQEVLANYKEGLQKEIADLKQQITDAKTRQAGATSESLTQSKQRDQFAAAKTQLATTLRELEQKMSKQLAHFPQPLTAEPKVSQAIEELNKDLKLPAEKKEEGASKRLLNLINLLNEAEKFQQTVSLRPQLMKDASGKEYNMQVIYFGLSCAYAVNDDASVAFVGKPTDAGWKFEESKDLATDIQALISSTTGDTSAAFVQLPFPKP